MGQVCIMNTSPEFSVSSCNTVCNSRISSILCVPPIRLKRNTITDTILNAKSDAENTKHKSKRNDSNSKEADESIIDTDSSEDLADSQSDDLHKANLTNIPPTDQNEAKYSTMWIGNDDGW